MTQTQITINAYPLLKSAPGMISIELGIGKDYPSQRFAIRNVEDCKTALQVFAAEIEATQKPWRLMISFDKKSGRKPSGFDKAQSAKQLECSVNAHLVAVGEN